ncbi:MAG: DUF1320 family protein [Dysgonomonas sp.]|jgi:phage gp36-like protein|uniref:phage protein Gp36 family protein n=1 Tax=Dysgonomonas sp. TaxID=1891233 RepID=UPI0039E48F87
MLVKVTDLEKTELYPEIIKKIVRDNLDDAKDFILDAEDLAKGYLSKYDLKALFGTDTEEPTHINRGLKKQIKAIAAWYLVKKANPNVNIELFRIDYEDAIKWLEGVQSGSINPELPYRPDDPDTPEDESQGQVWWGSNIKRKQNFD